MFEQPVIQPTSNPTPAPEAPVQASWVEMTSLRIMVFLFHLDPIPHFETFVMQGPREHIVCIQCGNS